MESAFCLAASHWVDTFIDLFANPQDLYPELSHHEDQGGNFSVIQIGPGWQVFCLSQTDKGGKMCSVGFRL